MKRALIVGIVALALGCPAELRAEEASEIQFAAVAQVTNLQALVVREAELNAMMRDVSSSLYQVLSNMRTTRERAMKQDKELKALNKRMVALQNQIDAMLMEKHAELATWEKERNDLMEAHDAIREEIMAVRERKSELMQKGAQVKSAMEAPVRNESETELETKE